MGLMALDLLRILGWGLVNFIYSIIDTLFEILKSLNAFDIISSVSNNNTFSANTIIEQHELCLKIT